MWCAISPRGLTGQRQGRKAGVRGTNGASQPLLYGVQRGADTFSRRRRDDSSPSARFLSLAHALPGRPPPRIARQNAVRCCGSTPTLGVHMAALLAQERRVVARERHDPVELHLCHVEFSTANARCTPLVPHHDAPAMELKRKRTRAAGLERRTMRLLIGGRTRDDALRTCVHVSKHVLERCRHGCG